MGTSTRAAPGDGGSLHGEVTVHDVYCAEESLLEQLELELDLDQPVHQHSSHLGRRSNPIKTRLYLVIGRTTLEVARPHRTSRFQLPQVGEHLEGRQDKARNIHELQLKQGRYHEHKMNSSSTTHLERILRAKLRVVPVPGVNVLHPGGKDPGELTFKQRTNKCTNIQKKPSFCPPLQFSFRLDFHLLDLQDRNRFRKSSASLSGQAGLGHHLSQGANGCSYGLCHLLNHSLVGLRGDVAQGSPIGASGHHHFVLGNLLTVAAYLLKRNPKESKTRTNKIKGE